jgi:hypothetical protein
MQHKHEKSDQVFNQLKDYDDESHSNTDFRKQVSSLYGLHGLVTLLASPTGFFAAARISFVQFCSQYEYLLPTDSKDVKSNDEKLSYAHVAQFVIACCRIRCVEDKEVKFMYDMLLKY